MFNSFSKKNAFHGIIERSFGTNSMSAFGFNGLKLWMDAAQGLINPINLGAVSFWQDLATGNPFLQPTSGNQPRWIQSDARFNGHPVIQGVDSARRLISSRLYGGLQTLALVANFDILNNGNVVLGYSLNQLSLIILGGNFGGYDGVGTRNTVNTLAVGYTESTSVKIGVISKNGVWVNGVQEYVGDTYLRFCSFDTLLGSSNVNTYGIIGSVAEVIGFDRDHDELDLSSALNTKYAIY